MTPEKIDAIIRAALISVQHIWIDGEDSMPVAACIGNDFYMVAPDPNTGFSDEGKEVFAACVRRTIADHPDIHTVAFTAEAWVAAYDAGQPLTRRPRDREDRQEVYQAHIETRDGYVETRTYEIKRDGKRKYVDGYDKRFGDTLVGGRMTGWFNDVL